MNYFERFHCPSQSGLCAAADSASEVVYMSMFYVPPAQRSIILKGDFKTQSFVELPSISNSVRNKF